MLDLSLILFRTIYYDSEVFLKWDLHNPFPVGDHIPNLLVPIRASTTCQRLKVPSIANTNGKVPKNEYRNSRNIAR
jgi:hypothetical protein